MVNFQFQKHLVTINVQCHACKFLSAYNSRVNWFIPGLSAIAHSSTNKVSIVSQNIVCHTALSIDTCCCLRNDVLQASQHLTRFWVALHSSIHQKTLFNNGACKTQRSSFHCWEYDLSQSVYVKEYSFSVVQYIAVQTLRMAIDQISLQQRRVCAIPPPNVHQYVAPRVQCCSAHWSTQQQSVSQLRMPTVYSTWANSVKNVVSTCGAIPRSNRRSSGWVNLFHLFMQQEWRVNCATHGLNPDRDYDGTAVIMQISKQYIRRTV